MPILFDDKRITIETAIVYSKTLLVYFTAERDSRAISSGLCLSPVARSESKLSHETDTWISKDERGLSYHSE